MTKKVKLLIFAKSVDGGTGTYALSLLKLASFQTKLVSFEKPKYREIDVGRVSYLRRKNYYPQKYFFAKNAFSFIADLLKFKKKIDAFNPNIVLGIESHANLMVQMCKTIFGYKFKTVLTTHIDLEKTLRSKSSGFAYTILKGLIPFFYQRADVLVAVSIGVARGLKKDFGITKKVTVIYNGITINKPFKRRKLSKTKTLICVGRLTEQKDHLTLIKAIQEVGLRFPETVLLIPSDGPLKQQLQRYVEKNNLSGRVKFLGWVKNLNALYDKSDLFVLATRREGFGYVQVEAMAASLPVISSDVDYGPREVLDNGKYGIMVPPGNVRAMAAAIIRIFSNPKIYSEYSKKAYYRALMFSEVDMLSGYSRIISSLKKK
jgi:glycosyltransferase involved in cell wall biosynthesis